MLTKQKDELYQLYVVYDSYSNYKDIEIPNKGLVRYNFGLPRVVDKLLNHKEYIEFIGSCCKKFIDENVFDDKYLAYKRWQKLLKEKVNEINDVLGKETRLHEN